TPWPLKNCGVSAPGMRWIPRTGRICSRPSSGWRAPRMRRVPAGSRAGTVSHGVRTSSRAAGNPPIPKRQVTSFRRSTRRRGNSRFADSQATLYNTRTAWGLAEAGQRLGAPEFTAAAARNLRAVTRLQHDDGWLPDCCLTDRTRPLLHTIAYGIRGLLEGGRVLEDVRLVGHAARAAERIAAAVGPDGRLPGRFAAGWSPAAPWSCLTGEAQMANIWLRLFEITGERKWLEPVEPVLGFLKSTQNRTSRDPGLRGGVKGSFPLGAE